MQQRRAVWITVIGAGRVGTAVAGSAGWIVLDDGTAVPLPRPPHRPVVDCPRTGANRNRGVERFDRDPHLVRVEVDDDGMLARVACLRSATRP